MAFEIEENWPIPFGSKQMQREGGEGCDFCH